MADGLAAGLASVHDSAEQKQQTETVTWLDSFYLPDR